LDSAQARNIGKVGGLTTAGRYDSNERMARARAVFTARFETEADPSGALPPEERRRRGMALYRAHMARLAARSAIVRAQKAGAS
jgi:hypothetical protein